MLLRHCHRRELVTTSQTNWSDAVCHRPLIMAKYRPRNLETILFTSWGVVLKELKECRAALKIIRRKEMIRPVKRIDEIFKETEELIAIVAKSIETAIKNKKGVPDNEILNIDQRKLNI